MPKIIITNANGSGPSRYQPGDGLANDWFSEDGSSQNVSDGSVGRKPHLLQAELDDALLVGRDGGALDADAMLLDCVSRINCYLVICSVSVLDSKIIIFKVYI